MNKEKKNFINILSCFLNNRALDNFEGDAGELYRLCDIHDVGAAAAYVLKNAKVCSIDDETASKFNQQIGKAVLNYEKREVAFEKVKKLFNSKNIDHIFVKGAVINKYYSIKEFRTSGDIDVIIRDDDYNQIINEFKSRNVKFADISSDTASVVTDGVNVEIHRGADAGTPYFDNLFDMCSVREKNTYILDDYEHLLYIICHLAKHLAYCGAGVRMLMDIDVMIRHIDSFNEDKLYSMSEKAGRLKTAQTLLSLCNLWFDTPVKDCTDIKNDTAFQNAFETVLIDGGCFGYENNNVPANYIGEFDEKGNLPFSKKVNAIMKIAFPGAEYLATAYPYAKKNKLLIPAAQINRLYDGLTKKSRQAKESVKQVASGSSVSKVQSDLLKELDIK